jgi:uncharacterized protein involved in exopolysaccharide biosynthesis
VGFAVTLLRQRWLVAAVTAGLVVVVSAVSLLQPRRYTSTSALMPQARRVSAATSALAAQFGLNFLNSEATESPAFYADLARSRQVLGALARTRFSWSEGDSTGGGTFVELYGVRGATPALQEYEAVKKLGTWVTTQVVQRTGVVRLSVRARQPELAMQMNARIIELLNEFNLRTRQSQAAAERRFTEQRVRDVQADLRGAEDRLQAFLQRNRDYRGSPELSFQFDRLQREVMLLQQVHSSLSQALEQAKIDEVRDTPVLTVVESPVLPVRPDGRGTTRRAVFALLFGLLAGSLLAVGREIGSGAASAGDPELEELGAVWREAVRDLLPFRRRST